MEEVIALKNIDFTIENGLVLCDESIHNNIYEELHIREKARKIGADAVLFRRFINENGNCINSKPMVYIFKREDSFFNSKESQDLHCKVWSSGDVDTYILLGKMNINILHARHPAKTKKKELDLSSLVLVSGLIKDFNDQRFSAHIFNKGLFWEQQDFNLNTNQTPFQIILEFLTATRNKINKRYQDKREREVLDKILLLTILVMFLEEKKDSYGNYALAKKYESLNIKSFSQILLDTNKCISFLEDLATSYDGQLFDLKVDEISILRNLSLEEISLFAEGKTNPLTQQIGIWRMYDFNYIPIEFISSVYESFLKSETNKDKGVVYTPPLLANFLVDEVMPLDMNKDFYLENGKISYKVLDPSCGSGIFLVSAYKRLLDWWIIQNFDHPERENQKYISDTFKVILEDNIFGVDINSTATQITIFSLTIAFLEKIDPTLLWGDFRFNKLNTKNIQSKDFFDWATQYPNQFDLIIGNPPFNNQSNKSQVNFDNNLLQKLNLKYKNIPGKKLALYFLETSLKLSKKTCIIIPSSTLYSEDYKQYRCHLFKDCTVSKIFDFTHLRDSLFNRRANVAVCAIVIKNSPSEQQPIEHIIINRLVSVEKKLHFEIDSYDCHSVSWSDAINPEKYFVWKANLLGGGRLFRFLNYLNQFKKLKQFILEKKTWVYSTGYNLNDSYYGTDTPASFLTGKTIIKPKSFKEDGFFEEDIEKNTLFADPRDERLYKGPHIIFQLILGNNKIPMAFVEKDIAFNISFVGIAAPQSDYQQLYEIYNRLYEDDEMSRLYRVFILSTTSKALIYHATSITKNDIDNLPYPEDISDISISFSEKIIIEDIINYYQYLNKSIFKAENSLNKIVDFKQLEQYGMIFCKTVNQVFKDDKQYWQIDSVYQTPNFTIFRFIYGVPTGGWIMQSVSSINEVDNSIKSLIFNNQDTSFANYTRVVREYDYIDGYDNLVLIKPNTNRYWLNSIALKDADITIYDYYKTGLLEYGKTT